MILKAKTTFKHEGHTFLKGVVYDVDKGDAKYFLATKWMEKSKSEPLITIGKLGYDPDTKWGDTGKKVMGN